MLRKNLQGDCPQISQTAYLDPTAVIIGRVKIGKNVFIGPGAVIRAEEGEKIKDS
jgi:carbonic anhydrase/acetyltransferase-like protein (isoleucine patch superfamily)